MKIRPFRDSDCEDVAALLDAIACAEPTAAASSAESFRTFSKLSFNAGARDFLSVEQGGKLVGLVTSTLLSEGEREKRHFRIFVHPACRRQGLGTRLFHEVQRQPLARGGVYQANCHQSWKPGFAFLRKQGFVIVERDLLMELNVAPRGASRGSDFEIFEDRGSDADDKAWVELHDEGYAHTPSYSPLTRDDLRVYREQPGFALWFAVKGDQRLGFCHFRANSDASRSILNSIVVSKNARRGGIARELIEYGLQRLFRQGCRVVSLFVDSENPGAVRLYRSSGFTTVDEVCTFWLEQGARSGDHVV